MAAPLRDLDDASELDADRIEIGPRIAWVLRMARLGSAVGRHGGAPTQTEMVELLARSGYHVNATLLSRVEAGARRLGIVADGYEAVLGLTPGQLRAPIDILCRTFPYAPPDMATDLLHLRGCDSHDGAAVIAAVGNTSERLRGTAYDGGDWLAWSRALACPRAGGFPTWLLEPWLDRLVSELGRSVGPAFATRYEALALLRCGPYGELVLRAAQRWVADPHVQVLYDLMSAVSEHPEPEVLGWTCSLLSDDRPQVVHGAVLALENMFEVGGLTPGDWDGVLDEILAAYAAAPPGSDIHASLSKILAALPPAQRRRAGAECNKRGLMPLVRPRRLDRKGRKVPANPQWVVAQRLASDVTGELGMERQPILERLLFEAVFEHRETRAVTSLFLLAALPFTGAVSRRLYGYALSEAPEDQRVSVLERLMIMQNGAPPPEASGWPDVGDPDSVVVHVTLQAQSGRPPDPDHLDLLLGAEERHRRRALYAAGLAGDDWLRKVAGASGPASERGAATWWLGQGRLVDDAPR